MLEITCQPNAKPNIKEHMHLSWTETFEIISGENEGHRMIREAVKEDAPTLNTLYKLLVPTSKNINVLPERIEQIRQDNNNFLFVFEEEGVIVGSYSP